MAIKLYDRVRIRVRVRSMVRIRIGIRIMVRGTGKRVGVKGYMHISLQTGKQIIRGRHPTYIHTCTNTKPKLNPNPDPNPVSAPI